MSFPDQGARPPGCGREATHEPVYDASCVRADPAQGRGHDAVSGRAARRTPNSMPDHATSSAGRPREGAVCAAGWVAAGHTDISDRGQATWTAEFPAPTTTMRCPSNPLGLRYAAICSSRPSYFSPPRMYGRYGLGKATGRGDQRAGGEHGTVGELRLGVVVTAARHLGVLGARTGTSKWSA